MPYVVKPISDWSPFGEGVYKTSPFSAGFRDSEYLMEREVAKLQGVKPGQADFIVELSVLAGAIRIDGGLKGRAVVSSPAVRISFQDKAGDALSFETDAFAHWNDNFRAIALGLESLRRFERYELGKGRQYAGWAQLPPGHSEPEPAMSKLEASALLHKIAAVPEFVSDAECWRISQRRVHPDLHGGDSSQHDEAFAAARALSLV